MTDHAPHDPHDPQRPPHRRGRTHRARVSAALLVAGTLAVGACTGPAAADGDPAGDPVGEPGSTPSVELRLGPLTTQNTLTLAAATGRLDDALHAVGATVREAATFPAFAPAAEAMAAGQIDMTSGSATSLVAALAGSPDLVVFAVEVNDGDTQGVVAAPGTGITSVPDLAGRTIAINEGGTGDYLLRAALADAGMSVDDVTPVHLAPPEAATAFASGQVDAWATWDQYLASAQLLDGAAVVARLADVSATNPSVHVVSRTFLEEHPDVVVAAYEALEAQADAVVGDPGVLEQAYREAGATPEVAAAVVAKRPPTIAPADDDFAADLAEVARFYAEQGMTPTAVATDTAHVNVHTLP